MTRLRVVLALLVVAGLVLGGAVWWEDRNFRAAGPTTTDTVVIIKSGEGARVIASDLAGAGVVKSPLFFRIGVMRRGKTTALKAGEYQFPAGASMASVMSMLVDRRVVQHRITIAEGLTSDMALALIDSDLVLEGAATTTPEGSLLPETYLFERGTTRADILARMHKAQEAAIAELWPKRKASLPLESPEQALNWLPLLRRRLQYRRSDPALPRSSSTG
jgi:peptidoglycan lytic transglycosylase G